MTNEKQLKEWLKGNPIHNHEKNKCCPDFSCCNSNKIADKELREKFVKAFNGNDTKITTSMCILFLSTAFPNE